MEKFEGLCENDVSSWFEMFSLFSELCKKLKILVLNAFLLACLRKTFRFAGNAVWKDY